MEHPSTVPSRHGAGPSLASIEDELRDYITKWCLPPEMSAEAFADDALIEGGLLDSVAIAQLSVHLEERYGIEVASDEITQVHFGSLASLARFIHAKRAGR
jgi:acyl carrier protein